MNTQTIDRARSMREKVDQFDWAATPLGARADWPLELSWAVEHLLDSDFPKALAWGEELTTIYNDAFKPILGKKPEALGRSFASVWEEAWDEIGPFADAVFEGRSIFIEDFPLVIDRKGEPEQAYFTFCYSPLRLIDGTVAGMLDTVVETTKGVEAKEHLELANKELAHRLSNSLAIVRAIASQTLRGVTDPDALTSFEHRLEALDHAHKVLFQQNWKTGSLRQAVWDSLEPHNGKSQVSVEGRDINIGSQTTMALSMMLHELATNALKYGALSNDSGQVEISWETNDGELHFEWRERGGPKVTQPDSSGFGSSLVRRGLGGASEGKIDFRPEGVVFSITAPVSELSR